MKSIIVPFFIPHNGCPNLCVFCNQVKITGTADFPQVSDIFDRISLYRQSSNCCELEVAFYGGSFTALPIEEQRSLLLPLQSMLALGDVNRIRVSTRPDAIDSSRVALLVEMGVSTVELGVQSMDEGVLTLANRGHDAACVEKACALLHDAGIFVGIQLMPGLPGDSTKKSLLSLDRVISLEPDFIRIYPALVIAETPLENLYRSGVYTPLSLDAAVGLCKIMLHKTMKAGIPVIRMGLQPTEDLASPGTILSGPYHPAFRQLVESELCFDMLSMMLRDFKTGAMVRVHCAQTRVSDVAGHGRENVTKILNQTGVVMAGICASTALSRSEFEVEGEGETRRGDLLNDIDYHAISLQNNDPCFQMR